MSLTYTCVCVCVCVFSLLKIFPKTVRIQPAYTWFIQQFFFSLKQNHSSAVLIINILSFLKCHLKISSSNKHIVKMFYGIFYFRIKPFLIYSIFNFTQQKLLTFQIQSYCVFFYQLVIQITKNKWACLHLRANWNQNKLHDLRFLFLIFN